MEKGMMTIGEKISDLRKLNKLTQYDLGNRLGVARQTLARWETGEAQPNLEDIEHMCSIFDVPIDYFFNRKPETEVAAEDSMKQQISEPVSEKTGSETKKKPWGALVVAIVFTVLTSIPLFFSTITGMIAFSPTQGVDVVFDHYFDFWSFFVSLCFAILCFSVVVVGWIRYILTKKR